MKSNNSHVTKTPHLNFIVRLLLKVGLKIQLFFLNKSPTYQIFFDVSNPLQNGTKCLKRKTKKIEALLEN